MNTIDIDKETRPLVQWLPREDSDELVYLARGGRTRFVVVPLDEGDEEVLAVRNNAKLMAYINASIERARKGPTKSLAQLKSELALESEEGGGGPPG